MGNVIISEDLVEINLDAPSKETAIKVLADKLKALDYVNDDYYENVIRREKNFPTGLPTVIPIALCHTEREFVKQSALAVGTLKHPIEFQEMGAPERIVKAEIIFLLALNDPKDQVPWLKKMMTVFKSKEVMDKIKFSKNNKELADVMKILFL
jgi:PTS system galactitol-specific IIA component